MFIQQGDVKLKKINAILSDAVKIKTDIVHEGRNHVHKIKGKFEIYELNNTFFIRTKSKCTLEHDEHGLCPEEFRALPIGAWQKSIVNEYNHFLEESKKVID
jgi:hypothetical protein